MLVTLPLLRPLRKVDERGNQNVLWGTIARGGKNTRVQPVDMAQRNSKHRRNAKDRASMDSYVKPEVHLLVINSARTRIPVIIARRASESSVPKAVIPPRKVQIPLREAVVSLVLVQSGVASTESAQKRRSGLMTSAKRIARRFYLWRKL